MGNCKSSHPTHTSSGEATGQPDFHSIQANNGLEASHPTYTFSGEATGKPDFHNIQANNGLELCEKLYGSTEEGFLDKYRMWILAHSHTGMPFWYDINICTKSNDVFNIEMSRRRDPSSIILVKIRSKDDSSPNSSPRDKGLQTPNNKARPLSPENIGKALSSLSESTWGISPTASEEPFETYDAINTHEPWLEIDITKRTEENSELKLIPLFFPEPEETNGKESVVLVDVSALENYFRNQIETDRALFEMDLTLEIGGKEKTFIFSEGVWVGSILPHSKDLRKLFCDATYDDSIRKAQVTYLKTNMENAYKNVLFWIDDLEDFDSTSWRLNRPIPGKDVPKYLSGYYFNEMEAHFLGNICIHGSVTILKEKLDEMFHGDAELSIHRDLSILLRKTFDVKSDFREGQDYKEKREAWLKTANVLRRNAPVRA